MKRSNVVLSRLCAFALVLLASVGLLAQGQNGVFVGTITDPSGAAVSGASVSVTNQETGLSTKAVTNNSGYYVTQPLPIGNYKFAVESAGFKTATKNNVRLEVGVTQRLDFRMAVGERTETVEVTTEAALVNTEDSKLTNNVNAAQIANLPLNGRNIYDLMKYAPGSLDVQGVLDEATNTTVVNGVRSNFNGFLLNGVSNKALSGGPTQQPIQDTVAEFQQLTLNMSAQYGNSAGTVTNVVTKSGTNSFHGSVFEFLRNEKLDANDYFNNNAGEARPPLRFNQFGATLGGPIFKDKLFFYGAYQGDRFITQSLPTPTTVESPEFRQAVIASQPNSVAALLYNDFVPSVSGTPFQTLDEYIASESSGSAYTSYAEYLCDGLNGAANVAKFASLFGVTAADVSALPGVAAANGTTCSTLGEQAGAFSRTAPFLNDAINTFKTRTQGNLFHGNEAVGRIDFSPTDNDRIFAQFNWLRTSDEFFGGINGGRGFESPTKTTNVNGQFSYTHSFTPTLLNEVRVGYSGGIGPVINAAQPGVPQVTFDDATLGFGSYSGYPQFFKENIYTYADMVSWTKGSHSIKFGADIRRNIENSEFNVGRPSYYFFDPLFFAVDAPYGMAAGTNPDLANGGTGANAELSTNFRHWRNVEFGAYFQDDWKFTPRLTLNLGLRYDLYARHTELDNLVTTFIPGAGTFPLDDPRTGAGQILSANESFARGLCTNPAANGQNNVLAGVCGPGGFAPTETLGGADHNNFGPRLGFAYDVFGNGKTSLRGGFGVSFEGTLYNPLSNSRWNPPYYSFNNAFEDFLNPGTVVYGPSSGGAPRYTGDPDPLNRQGTGATATGNIMGWNPTNPNLANLTGIVFPAGIRDPYVYNYYLGFQQEVLPKLVMEANYVGTTGHKLFRAENVNRKPGSILPVGTCVVDLIGREVCGLGRRRLNDNYGRLRVWANNVNSNYNSFQFSLRKALSHGLQFNVFYTWSHAIDGGSTWHSGATSANNRAGGEGFTSDQSLPGLDRGNSIFDVRHNLSFNYVWELPFFKDANGFLRNVFGGWQFNGIVSYHTGAHWMPYCDGAATCDFNGDGERNDRPSAALTNFDPSKQQYTDGWASSDPRFDFGNGLSPNGVFQRPCATVTSGVFAPTAALPCAPGSMGNLGRNTFVGPSYFDWSPSMFKNFKFTETVGLQFRWEVFNVLNRTNFILPGGAPPGQTPANHNNVLDQRFGQAGGTFNPRNMQVGLRLTF